MTRDNPSAWVWVAYVAIIIAAWVIEWGSQQLRLPGRPLRGEERRTKWRDSSARVLVLDGLIILAYAWVVSYPGSVGWADILLFAGLGVHWLIWALAHRSEAGGADGAAGSATSDGKPPADPSVPWSAQRPLRLLLVVALMVAYAIVTDPYIPSGTVRYVHSHGGDQPALQTLEVRCGPLLQAVVPFVDRVYDYPLGFQRLQFSEGGHLPPIRTETRNGHEVELDVVVVYRMFPQFGIYRAEPSKPDSCREAAAQHLDPGDLSPPHRFGQEWEQRFVEPLIHRVVRDNVNPYYLNQVYSSDSRALIQAMILAELNGQPSRRLRRASAGTTAEDARPPKPHRIDLAPTDGTPGEASGAQGEPAGAVEEAESSGTGRAKAPHLTDPGWLAEHLPYLITFPERDRSQTDPPYQEQDEPSLARLRGQREPARRAHSLAGRLFTFREVVILDVRILDREFAERIRRKHLKEEAREELVIEGRRLHEELRNVKIRQEIELNEAVIASDRIKIVAEAELQRARLEADGIRARGLASAEAQRRLVAAHGSDSAVAAENFVRIQMARFIAAGIQRIIITPELENLVPIVGDMGKVMDSLPNLIRHLPHDAWYRKQEGWVEPAGENVSVAPKDASTSEERALARRREVALPESASPAGGGGPQKGPGGR